MRRGQSGWKVSCVMPKARVKPITRYALLKQLPVTFLWSVDEPTLLTAARFKAQHHLSLADALIASFAHQHGAVLVHKDPEFEALAGQVRQEPLPYKSSLTRNSKRRPMLRRHS